MEGSQSQEAPARAEGFTDRPGRVMDLLWISGGVVFIVLSAFVLTGLTFVTHAISDILLIVFHLVTDWFIFFLFCLGLTALFMLAVYCVLPVRMDRMRDALVQGAGLALLVYPFMIVRDSPVHIAIDVPFHGPYLGIETPYWFIYSSLGVLLLAQPWLIRVSPPGELVHTVLTNLGLCLGLLSMAWTLLLISRSAINGTYSAVLITASLAVVVFTVMYAVHPRMAGIKSAAPRSYEWQRGDSMDERPQGQTGTAVDSDVPAHGRVYWVVPSWLSRLVLWLVTVFAPAVLVSTYSGFITIVIFAPLWIFVASEGTGMISIFLGLVSRPDLVPVVVLSILATSMFMTFPVLLPTVMLELVLRRRDWLGYARFMILAHPAFILFIEVFFLATGASALVVPVPLTALVQYLRYRQLRVTLRGVSHEMLLPSPTA